jgi:hypothetical protein
LRKAKKETDRGGKGRERVTEIFRTLLRQAKAKNAVRNFRQYDGIGGGGGGDTMMGYVGNEHRKGGEDGRRTGGNAVTKTRSKKDVKQSSVAPTM